MTLFKKAIISILVVLLFAVVILAGWYLLEHGWIGSDALATALKPIIDGKNTENAAIASTILQTYRDTRFNASAWSFIYWGLTFFSAIASALSALILKFETIIKNEGIKKDIAASFSVLAALLITISTSGDFQRKWQANRIAAAELEHLAYSFISENMTDAHKYMSSVGEILLNRNLAIAGNPRNQEQSHKLLNAEPTTKSN